jgi:hypothetical protein
MRSHIEKNPPVVGAALVTVTENQERRNRYGVSLSTLRDTLETRLGASGFPIYRRASDLEL